MADVKAPILELKHISKRFASTQALNDLSLTLYPGEIHALLGENGAGKSTLIKIITGVYQPDQGEIVLNGKPIKINSSVEAQSYGIAAIYQEPMVFPDLTVAENIFITHGNRGPIVQWGRMNREAEQILAQLDVHLDVRQPARGLTLAAQQTVEIAKAISLQANILIMDEPTASLSAHEVEQLFTLVSALRERGVAIIYISHRMEEVFRIADRITILRDGRRILQAPRSQVTPESAIRDMVGRKLTDFFIPRRLRRGAQFLAVENLGKTGAFSGVNFEVYRREVLGIAGLVGARRTDVGLALFGIEPADSGQILIDGKVTPIRSPEQALRNGIAYATEDRRQLGLSLPMSVVSNITLPTLHQYLNQFGLVRRKAETVTAEQFRDQLHIRTPSIYTEASKLSGGNQQKVMLSKWLNARPQLLILDEPTRGIDVASKAEVHQLINNLVGQDLAIILISSDLPEVMAMSDRILVMREGRQMGIFDRQEATQERILAAAMGQLEGGGVP